MQSPSTPLVAQIKQLEESILNLQVKQKTLTETGKKRRNKKKRIAANLKKKNERLRVLKEKLASGVVSEQTLETEIIQNAGVKLKVLHQVNPAHTDPVHGVCFLPNNQVASACEDNTVQIFTIESQTCTAILDHESPVRCITSLPNSCIATGTDEGALTVWSIDSPNEPILQETLDSPITCLVAVPGPALLVGLESGVIHEFVVSKTLKRLKDFSEIANKAITKVVPYGELVLSSSLDGSVRIWDFAEKVCVNKLKFPRPVKTFDVFSDRLVIAQEKNFFACSLDNVKAFDVFGKEGDSEITSMSICGNYLATSYASGTVSILDYEKDSEVASLEAGNEVVSLTSACTDHLRISAGCKNGTINMWGFPHLNNH